ncbi:hypothetical protein, partial [Acetobacter sp. DmW_125123]
QMFAFHVQKRDTKMSPPYDIACVAPPPHKLLKNKDFFLLSFYDLSEPKIWPAKLRICSPRTKP